MDYPYRHKVTGHLAQQSISILSEHQSTTTYCRREERPISIATQSVDATYINYSDSRESAKLFGAIANPARDSPETTQSRSLKKVEIFGLRPRVVLRDEGTVFMVGPRTAGGT